jgi:hypothetical protein
MDLYSRFILPQVIELAMGQKTFAPFRERVVGAARGRVLEIGIGSGLNLASYIARVRKGLWSRPVGRASVESQQSSQYHTSSSEIGRRFSREIAVRRSLLRYGRDDIHLVLYSGRGTRRARDATSTETRR